jgi:hypothetical protein
MNNADQIQELAQRLRRLTIEHRATTTALEQISRELDANIYTADTDTQGDRYVDRDGNPLEVGQRVELLTQGLYRGNVGRVRKVSPTRVTIRLDSGRTTTRIHSNVRIIE